MLRYKLKKQTLLIAVLAILLCLVCLAGATLALFTNDLKDGTIGVITTSGNIEVDIVDTSPEENSLKGKVLQFQTTKEQKDILFEPGAVYCTQGFRIKNTGNVRINFLLTVSEDDDIDMTKFHEAFEVWISTSPSRSADAKLLTEFRGDLTAGDKGTLLPGDLSEETYYLHVKMKETAGNEFQGAKYDGIGITVHAVQGNVSVDEGVTNNE